MVGFEEIQAAYYMVAATGVLVAAIYYVMNLRAQKTNMKATLDTRQAQLLMQIYQRFSETDFMRKWVYTIYIMNYSDIDDFDQKYEPKRTSTL